MKAYCIRNVLKNVTPILLALFMFPSCDSMIYDDEGNCEVSYRVKFVYDRNLKFADAFGVEVDSVSLYAFDMDGRLAWSGTEAGEALSRKDYAMTVGLRPGVYDMIAWCYGNNGGQRFVVGNGGVPQLREDIYCSLHRNHADGVAVVDRNLQRLYHGRNAAVCLPDTFGTVEREIHLMKNTNSIRIMLQHLNGRSISKDDFDFKIIYANGLMGYDNSLLDDEPLTYRPHVKRNTQAVIGGEAGGDTQTEVQGVFAEISTARLMAANEPLLIVTDRTRENKEIIRIPLCQYALMVKGQYTKALTDQEYLDYQDEYAMTFFLDDSNDWYTGVGIYINSWHVVPPQDETLTGKY